MFKAEIHNDTTDDILTMADLKPCQLAVVVTGGSSVDGSIVMRTANIDKLEVMDLSNPGEDSFWEGIKSTAQAKVKLLPKGAKVTLTVE